MFIAISWAPVLNYKRELKSLLPNLCASLCEKVHVTGFLVALPKNPADRDWLFSFTSSLKRTGIDRIVVLIHSKTLSASDIDECMISGIDEILIVQDQSMHEKTLDILRRVIPIRSGRMPKIRIWLDFASAGLYNQNVCAWKRSFPAILSIERNPFMKEPISSNPEILKLAGVKTNNCIWQQSVLTISNSGNPMPCPYYYNLSQSNEKGHNTDIRDLALTDYPILAKNPGSACIHCHKQVKYMLPYWFNKYENHQPIENHQLKETYYDFIKGNAEVTSEDKKKLLLSAFVNRVKMSKI